VGDAGDELSERRELLRLPEAFAQRRLLRFQSGLMRDVPRHEHVSVGLPSALISGVIVTRKVPPRRGSSNRLVSPSGPASANSRALAHAASSVADKRVERLDRADAARPSVSVRERVVRLHDWQLVVGDDDQIQNRD
jgi:hypothetical protein